MTWLIKFLLRFVKGKEAKRAILTEAVKHLYKSINADDILHEMPNGEWIFLGRPLVGQEVLQLKEEARTMLAMRLWKVIRTDIRYQLGKKMFEEARVLDDILWGQLLTYLDDIIRTRLKNMLK